MLDLPFTLHEIEIPEEISETTWHPDLNKKYMIEYRWKGDKISVFLIGTFNEVWYGYTFYWFWGSASIQLNIKGTYDIRRFRRIWEFRLREFAEITNEDIEI